MSIPGASSYFLRMTTHHEDGEGRPAHFESLIFRDMFDISEEKGKVTVHLPVSPKLANHLGNMHGGCIGTLVDTIGSAALVTMVPYSHVSLSITTNYMSPAVPGSTLRVVGEVTKMGKTIAHMLVSVYDKDKNTLLAQGTHIKFIQRDINLMASNSDLVQKLAEEHNPAKAKTAAKGKTEAAQSKL